MIEKVWELISLSPTILLALSPCMYVLVTLKFFFLVNCLSDEWFDHTVEFVIFKSLQQDITWLYSDERKIYVPNNKNLMFHTW